MIKIIILFISLFLNIVYANTIIINDNTNISHFLSSKVQTTYIDKTHKLTIANIKNLEKFEKIDKTNFRASKNNIWIKFSIKNLTNNKIDLFFENDRALIDIIDIYVYKGDKYYKKIELGDFRDIKRRELKVRKSTFPLHLEKNIIYTFYIMEKSYSSISTNWKISNRDNYIKDTGIELIVWGIYVGIAVALILFYLVLFFIFKEFSFLVYSILGFSFLVYQGYVNGFYYKYMSYLNIQWLDNLNWPVGFFTQAIVILFPIVFFKPKKNTFIFKLLFSLFSINILLTVLFTFSLINPEIRYFTKYTDFLTLLTTPVLFLVSIWALKNNYLGSIYYFLGQITTIFLIFYAIFAIIGYIEPSPHMWLVIPLSIIFDMVFISFALFERIKKIQIEKIENMQILISQSRFLTLGQTTADLTHQWKTPISQLGSHFTLLKAIYNLDNKNFNNTFEDTLPKIENSLSFLNHTMDDIYNFYSNPLSKEKFIISDEIESVLKLIENKIKHNEIQIIKEYVEISYYGYKGSLLNALLSIIDNAIFELVNFKDTNRKIFISLENRTKKISIKIQDNAGGIKVKNFERLFKIDYSSKEDKGSGIGLALAKKLINTRLKGDIIAYNDSNNAVFEIVFPKN